MLFSKKQIRKRERLLRLAKRSKEKSSHAWKVYRRYRKKVTKALKNAHNRYLNEVVGESLEANPKRFWNYVKHCHSEVTGVPTLRSNNATYISAKDKAELQSNHFQSVYTVDDGTVPDLGPPKSIRVLVISPSHLPVSGNSSRKCACLRLLDPMNYQLESCKISFRNLLICCVLFFSRALTTTIYLMTGLRQW